jgi:hypothetical protein
MLWLAVLVPTFASAQMVKPSVHSKDYSISTLGFKYTPPPGMRDETANGRLAVQSRAKALKTDHVFDVLLTMESGGDDSQPWCSVTIEAYPRSSVAELDDLKAEAQMSAWVAGFAKAGSTPKQTVISGQTFAVSVLALQEGPTKKGAVIWTTIRKGKLLSFAFAANSPERLKALTETMKTVQFF